MKGISLIFALFIMLDANSGEFTGAGSIVEKILSNNNMSLESLRNRGLDVLIGEITGFSKEVHIDDIEYIITDEELLEMRNVTHVNFRNRTQRRRLRDVENLEFNRRNIPLRSIKGTVFSVE